MKKKALLLFAIVSFIFSGFNLSVNAQCGKNNVAMWNCVNNKCHNVCVPSTDVALYQTMGYFLGKCTRMNYCGGFFLAKRKLNSKVYAKAKPVMTKNRFLNKLTLQ
jgi:hypothetical protein